jgi:hypothetical protein
MRPLLLPLGLKNGILLVKKLNCRPKFTGRQLFLNSSVIRQPGRPALYGNHSVRILASVWFEIFGGISANQPGKTGEQQANNEF